MKEADCYRLGEVIKTHGLNGELNIHLDVDFPEDYRKLESVFVKKDGKLVPFFIDKIQINAAKAVVKFEDVDSIESAKELVKSELYLPIGNLPQLSKGQFYFHELVGCEVFEEGRSLGKATEVYDLESNRLLAVDFQGKEILIPINDEILTQVDTSKGEIHVSLPDGLLDIYNE